MQTSVVKKINNTPTIRTHKYAKLAYPLVNAIKGTDIESKYRTLALNLPTMILQSGLVQAIGFLMAKNESHHQEMYEHLTVILNNQHLYDEILNADIKKYQRLTYNTIEATSWLKRYTQALLAKDKIQEQNNDPVDA